MSWLFYITSIKVLDKVEIEEESKTKLYSLSNKLQIPIGLISLIIGLIGILDILTDVLSYII